MELLQHFLSERGMAPHGYCLLWEPELIWAHVASDLVIGLAYFSIPVVIARFLTKRRDVEFSWVVWMFAVFIMACGATHFMSILVLWVPAYGIEALVKIITAIASVTVAIALWPLLPRAIAVPSPRLLQQVNDELRALVVERDAALVALERESAERQQAEAMLRQSQKMEAVGQLTSGLAHDFNNLLTIVLASIDRATRLAGDNAPLIRSLGHAQDGAERAAKLTDQLLSFSRRQPLLAQEHDLNATVADLGELLGRTLGDGVALRLELAPDLPTVRIDGNQLANALINLAVNARQAMPDGGTVTVSTRLVPPVGEVPAQVVVAVADSGTGISEELKERVFEPFFTTKPVGEGTGLGLSQVYGFAKQAGGEVGIDSAAGEGTTVSIRLPVTAQSDAARS